MKTLKDPLVWIDCEMTGLDVERDALIEVAVVVTDGDLRIVDPGMDVLITPPAGALENMNDFVRNMHTSSGLLEDLETSAVSMEEATEQVLSYIKRFVPQEGKALLAGNSVGTDKMFLEANMPSVVEHLHYRLVDVSSIKELAKRWYRAAFTESPDKHGGHRALADILESIQELEYYRRVLFPAEPVTTERGTRGGSRGRCPGHPGHRRRARGLTPSRKAASPVGCRLWRAQRGSRRPQGGVRVGAYPQGSVRVLRCPQECFSRLKVGGVRAFPGCIRHVPGTIGKECNDAGHLDDPQRTHRL